MRRLIAAFLMAIFTIQLSWAEGRGLVGHLNIDGDVSGFHLHHYGHDHQDAEDSEDAVQESEPLGLEPGGYHSDRSHEAHHHPAFNAIVQGCIIELIGLFQDECPSGPVGAIRSYIPQLPDQPPNLSPLVQRMAA